MAWNYDRFENIEVSSDEGEPEIDFLQTLIQSELSQRPVPSDSRPKFEKRKKKQATCKETQKQKENEEIIYLPPSAGVNQKFVSGKVLQDKTEWKLNDLCPCDSNKLYRKCCKRRNVVWYQDENGDPYQIRTMPIPDGTGDMFERLKEKAKKLNPTGWKNERLFGDINEEQMVLFTSRLLGSLSGLGPENIDPCYIFCYEETHFCAKYWERMIPKNECKLRKLEWNEAVEHYIEKQTGVGKDTRDPDVIRKLNCISYRGGPLYRACYYCQKVEKEQNEYKRCADCDIACYCSTKCQKKHWKKQHKKDCKKGTVPHQSIPSVKNLEKMMTLI